MKYNTIIKIVLLLIVILSFIQFTNKTNLVIEGNKNSDLLIQQDIALLKKKAKLDDRNTYCCPDITKPVVVSELKITTKTCKNPKSDRSCDETGTYTQKEIDELLSGASLEACKIPPSTFDGDYTVNSFKNPVQLSTLYPENYNITPSTNNIEVGNKVTYKTSKSDTTFTGIVIKTDDKNNEYRAKPIGSTRFDIIKKKDIKRIDIGLIQNGDYLYDTKFKPFMLAYYNKDTNSCTYPAPKNISGMTKPTGDVYRDYYSPSPWNIRTNVCKINGKRCISSSNPSIMYPNPNKGSRNKFNNKYRYKTPSGSNYSYIVGGPMII